MGKIYQLAGCFLMGFAITGLFSFTAYAFPQLRAYGFWISIAVSLLMIVLAAGDDFFADFLGLNYQQYIGALISLVAVLLIGSVIQWIR